MPRLVALLLAAAATAASAESDENNFTAASADEGRVKKYAAQSYDWLADRAPAAKAFAAQAAVQHTTGCGLGGQTLAVRGGAETIERGYASISAPPTARWHGEQRVSRRSTGKNRPLSLKPTLPRVLSRANASVVDEE